MRKRRILKTGAGLLTGDQRDYLLEGASLNGPDDCRWPDGSVRPFSDEAAMKAAWFEHRAALMEHCGPGRRPWAWWRFVAPEPRRQLAGPPPLPRPNYAGSTFSQACSLADRYSFGIPSLWPRLEDYNRAVFESELGFLRRLDLLLPGEAEAIETEAQPAPADSVAVEDGEDEKDD